MYKKIITVCCCSESHPSECFIFQLDSSVKLIIELRERERERERKRERGGESLCSCARPRDCCVAGSCGPSLFPARVHPPPLPPIRRRVPGAARCVRQGAAVSRSEAAPLPLHHREENTTRWRFRIAALLSRRGSARTANFQY